MLSENFIFVKIIKIVLTDCAKDWYSAENLLTKFSGDAKFFTRNLVTRTRESSKYSVASGMDISTM